MPTSRVTQSHKDLRVWQMGVDLSVLVYDTVKQFPPHERFGLVSQMTRAAVSVPANIAEGNARGSTRDYAHFISIARGSLMEVDTYVTIAARIGYVSQAEADSLQTHITDLSKMLRSLRERLVTQST